jgi:DNA-binding CsgD family transcriptional regulator
MNKISLPFFCFLFALFQLFNSEAQVQIITSGDNWLYYDAGYLDNNWYLNLDMKKGWKQGITPIGYGDRKVITSIQFGGDEERKHITKYFQKTVELTKPSEYLAYGFQFKRDDGIAIYLNGEEVFRDNLPSVALTGKTRAIDLIDSDKESEVLMTVLDAHKFKKGKNTIAVSIHQVGQSSSDCIFDFEMFGYKDSETLSKILSKKSQKNDLEDQVRNLTESLSIEKSILQFEVQKARAENLRFLLITLGGLLIVSIGIIVFLGTSSRKKEQKLLNEIQSLQDDIRNKEQGLMTLSTKLLHNRQYFKEIKADIKGLKSSNNSTIKNILYHIDLALESEHEWENLQKHFNAIYSGFYDKILSKHPSLTEIELRHCMFIKLHLQTKEIAKILLIDPRSVQTARYRIKKKMNLDEDIDLRAYLLKITS